jgi:hypothetical protein
MTIILGLDVSTSCTGYCIVDSDIPPDDKGSHILDIDRIEFGKFGKDHPACKTIWEKADRVKRALEQIELMMFTRCGNLHIEPVAGYRPGQDKIERVVLEEALLGFRPGMSSAMTISTLMRFNGIVSYLARETLHVEPEYIGSAHARKLCGIKLQRTAVAGMSQKEQVFKHMSEHDLKFKTWPLKKNGIAVDWSRDATDAYVIARAASVNGPIVPVKKTKKSKKDD